MLPPTSPRIAGPAASGTALRAARPYPAPAMRPPSSRPRRDRSSSCPTATSSGPTSSVPSVSPSDHFDAHLCAFLVPPEYTSGRRSFRSSRATAAGRGCRLERPVPSAGLPFRLQLHQRRHDLRRCRDICFEHLPDLTGLTRLHRPRLRLCMVARAHQRAGLDMRKAQLLLADPLPLTELGRRDPPRPRRLILVRTQELPQRDAVDRSLPQVDQCLANLLLPLR